MGGFTSLLKKLGQVLAAGLTITSTFYPILRPFLGGGSSTPDPHSVLGRIDTGVNDLTAIGTTVVQIETALNGKSGPEKLAAAVALVRPIIQTSELVSGHQIGNEAEFIASCTDITNGIVRLMNSLKSDNIKTSGDGNVASAAPAMPVAA